MSASGSPSTAMRSASLPVSTVPTSFSISSSSAVVTVADRIASIGGMPPATIRANSLALSPCGPTPQSVPKAILTPAA